MASAITDDQFQQPLLTGPAARDRRAEPRDSRRSRTFHEELLTCRYCAPHSRLTVRSNSANEGGAADHLHRAVVELESPAAPDRSQVTDVFTSKAERKRSNAPSESPEANASRPTTPS